MLHARSRRGRWAVRGAERATLAPDGWRIELFGVEGSADPGASHAVGVLEQAHGGTLFLDEVADMPLETQGKIVRVRSRNRLSSASAAAQRVRSMSASSRPRTAICSAEIAGGRFREDLYYRLNVVPMRIPPCASGGRICRSLARHFMRAPAIPPGLPSRES
jgi:two-component system nitrogen regulation response regulator NtrX